MLVAFSFCVIGAMAVSKRNGAYYFAHAAVMLYGGREKERKHGTKNHEQGLVAQSPGEGTLLDANQTFAVLQSLCALPRR
jgi:hypothetical protein